MTTVAWDGKRLAVDTKASAPNPSPDILVSKLVIPSKKVNLNYFGNRIVAIAVTGSWTHKDILFNFPNEGECCIVNAIQTNATNVLSMVGSESDLVYGALMITDTGVWIDLHVSILSSDDRPIDINWGGCTEGNYALGSGSVFAKAAMAIGMDSVAGVLTACKYDGHTAAPVLVFDFESRKVTRIPENTLKDYLESSKEDV